MKILNLDLQSRTKFFCAESRTTAHARHPKLQFLVTLVVAAIVSTLLAVPAVAQSFDAEVEFFVKPSEEDGPLTVGDQISFRLEIVHPADSRVVLPQLEEQWGPFDVIEQSPPETVTNRDGTATTGKDIVVTVFRPGEYQTPTLVITHRKSNETVEELAAPVIPIRVTSILTEDTSLRDLKPQAELPTPPIWPWVVGGLLSFMLLSGLLVGAALWYHHRRQQQLAPALSSIPVVDPRPPQVIAHAELDRIEALDLPRQDRVKEHYTLVSTCLRRYIEGVYQFPALEQTTGELRNAFRRAAVPVREMGGFMSLFSESDLVKFARYKPHSDNIYSLIARARAVVDATAPEPEPVEPAAELEEMSS